jgi:hypothetical protein
VSNTAFRAAKDALIAEYSRRAVDTVRAQEPEIQRLNRLVEIATSGIWRQIKADLEHDLDTAEMTKQTSYNKDKVFEARGEAAAIMRIILRYDGAEQKRATLQQQQEEMLGTQDAAHDAAIGAAVAE